MLLLQYIGVHDGRMTYEIPSAGPQWLDLKCEVCNATHRYTRADFEWYRTAEPPAPGFVDRLRSR